MPERATYQESVMASLTRIIGEWTAPDFLTAVVAREGVELDPAAITMITILASDGPLRPSTLATKMVTGASNVSKVAARLAASGMVNKVADPADARAGLLRLTPAGKRVATSFVRAGDGLVAELLGDWSAAERTQLAALLSKLEQSTIEFSARLRAEHPSGHTKPGEIEGEKS